jgi:glycosyltransferase involved in cell wall biosynthesis
MYQVLCKTADTVTVPTEAMAIFLRKFARIDVATLPFPLDVWDVFNPSLYTHYLGGEFAEWARHRSVIVYSGTLSSSKGCDALPRIAERVRAIAKSQNVGFLVIGDGPSRNSIENKVRELGLGVDFKFAGNRSGRDFAYLLSLGSVALSLSPKPGVDFVPRNLSKIATYLAMGKPVVAVEDTSAKECIEHGKTGYVQPLDSVPAALVELIDQPYLRESMAESARERAESTHDCVTVALKLLGIADVA